MRESFLRNDKSQIKLLSRFFSNLHSTFYKWLKLKKIITHRVSKIHEWIWGVCMNREKFLKSSEVTDQIFE